MITIRTSWFQHVAVALGCIVAAGLAAFGITLLREMPAYGALLTLAGAVGIFVSTFQLPLRVEVTAARVEARYLFGLHSSFPRGSVRVRLRGYSPGTIVVRATDRSFRARLIGSFKLNLALVSNSAEALQAFGLMPPN